MALKYKTDIIPFSTVNGEYINPHAYSSSRIDKFVNKLGLPFLPLGPISVLFPFQPWVFYCGMPAKLTFVMGKRIEPYKFIDKPFEEITEDEIKAIRDRVNKQMQDELTEAVRKYGHSPYKIGEFLWSIVKNFKQLPYSLPFGWPLSFLEFERRYQQEKRKGSGAKKIKLDLGWGSSLRILFQNPFAWTFFIPILGWIPIALKSIAAKSKKTAK